MSRFSPFAPTDIEMATPAPHSLKPQLRLIGPGDNASGGYDVAEAFRHFSAYVAHIATRILGREDDIDDLVQDVFCEAVSGLKKLREPAAAKGWLATVTVRMATRRLRLRRLRLALHLDAPVEEVAWPGASPEQSAMLARVYRRLEKEPARHRIAWILRVVEGESLETVAQVCSTSLPSVKRWIRGVQDRLAEEGIVNVG
ncbi:MAG: sigma-70 family RNA polymerase sigma factor [Deltaproteobacteria bacterium]|nr:sigma-70 family RNA polymerase sigma factor [Deltaproteobacteria bacterium]